MSSYSDGTMHSSDKFYLNIPDNDDSAADLIKKGEKLEKVGSDLICHSPIYCHMLRINPSMCDLQYWMFYPNDVPVGWFDSDMGAHEGDWEHVSVRLHWPESYPEDGSKIDPMDQAAFSAIYGSAHSGEGSWNDKPTWESCGDGILRPAIYAAQGTHANYSTLGDDGTINRAFSDDYVSKTGAYWETANNVVQITWSADLPDNLAWLGFNGRWGATRDKIKVSSPTGPAMKSQFTKGDPTNPMVPKSG